MYRCVNEEIWGSIVILLSCANKAVRFSIYVRCKLLVSAGSGGRCIELSGISVNEIVVMRKIYELSDSFDFLLVVAEENTVFNGMSCSISTKYEQGLYRLHEIYHYSF